MSSGMFDAARQAIGRGQIAWESADIRVLLVKDTYSFDPTHSFVADLVAHELGATDYARKTTTGRIVGPSSPTYFLMDDVLWVGLGGASNQVIGGAVVYLHTGSDATARLICFIDTPDQLTQDQDTYLAFATSRVFQWTG